MDAVLSYAVAVDGKAQVFSVSPTGTLDYEGSFDEAEAKKQAALIARYPEFLAAEMIPQDDWGADLYLAGSPRPRVFVYGEDDDEIHVPRPEIDGFMARYPSFAKALADGDVRLIALLAQRSRKLRPFLRLVGHIAGSRCGLGFALYWLSENDRGKEAVLDALLSGDASEASPYAAAFSLARPYIQSRSAEEYRIESSRRIVADLERGSRLVLPVASAQFRPCLDKLCALVSEARRQARLRRILDGGDVAAADALIDAYLATFTVTLRPEPYNRADRNAVGVWLRPPDAEAEEQAGYLPRGLAAVFSPELSEGFELRVELYRLSEGEAEIRLASFFAESALLETETGI
jgi:hypothetical protein